MFGKCPSRPGRVSLLGMLLLAACAAPSSNPVTPPTASTPAASTPTTPAASTPTTPSGELAGLCNGYLVLLRTGDSAPLRGFVDESVAADIDTMLSSEGEFAAISAAAVRVEDFVVSRCTDRYTAGVVGAPDDGAALAGFMDALASGDSEAGSKLAWAHVVAQFPWAAQAGLSYEVDGSTATATLSSTRTLTCRAQRGAVVSCRFGEMETR